MQPQFRRCQQPRLRQSEDVPKELLCRLQPQSNVFLSLVAVIAAVLSSNADIPIPSRYAFAAEVGLSGEIRAVTRIEARIAEADKLGFEKIFISKYNAKGLDTKRFKIEIVPVASVYELGSELFR